MIIETMKRNGRGRGQMITREISGIWKDKEVRTDAIWTIISPLVWYRPVDEQRVELSEYLLTDYASIPRLFWCILPKRDKHYDIAAAFHDNCIYSRNLLNMSKMDCHRLFKEIMIYFDTPKWKYRLMFSVVVIAGVFASTKGNGINPWKAKLTPLETAKYRRIKEAYPWRKITR